MSKLKVFKVDEYTYWCDYSKEEAIDNYINFCDENCDLPLFTEKLFKDIYEKAVELSEEDLENKIIYNPNDGSSKTFKEELNSINYSALFHSE